MRSRQAWARCGGALLGAVWLITLAVGRVGGCDDERTCPHNVGTVVVGVFAPMTGSLAAIGKSMERGVDLWAGRVNERGGIKGSKVQVIVRDDQAQPPVAVEQAKVFIERDKVDMLFGPRLIAPAMSVLAYTEASQQPAIVSARLSRAASETLQWAVSIVAPFEEYLTGSAEVAKSLGVRRIGLLFAANLAEPLRQGTQAAVKAQGVDVTEAMFAVGQTDFASEMGKFQADKAEGVFVMGAGASQAITLAQVIREKLGKSTMLVFGDGADTAEFRDRLGADGVKGVFRPALWHQVLKTPGNADFVKRFQTLNREQPDQNAALGYATGEVFEKALTIAYDPAKRIYLRGALRGLKATTIIGNYAIGKGGLQTGQRPLIVQWQDGKEEVVWPKELATAVPRKP